jgi:NTE family protein
VPIAFPTVVLKNRAGECDPDQSHIVKYVRSRKEDDPRMQRINERIHSYLDRQSRPYIHLVDGGLADNLGLRALADRIETQARRYFLRKGQRIPRDVLVITVNAQVKPERGMDLSADKPSIGETLDAMSDVQMSLYNVETKLLLQNKINELQAELKAHGIEVRFHLAEVAFDSVEAKTLKSLLNSLPTSLELSDRDVDILIDTGARLLRKTPGYRDFMEINHGCRTPAPGEATAALH